MDLMVIIEMSASYKEIGHLSGKNTLQTFHGENKVRFGERLREAIGDESILSFAKRCGLSDTLVGKYVKGMSYPGIDKMPVIAKATGKSIAWFFEEEEVDAVNTADKPQYSEEELNEWWKMISKTLTLSELAAIVEIFKQGGKNALINNGLNTSLVAGISQSSINTALMLESLSPEARKEILAQYGLTEQGSPVAPGQEPHKKAV